MAYPLYAVGLVLLIRVRDPRSRWGARIDSAIIAVGGAVLSWIFLIQPYIEEHGFSVAERLTSIAYPVMDILLLAVLGRLFAAGAARNMSFRMLAGMLVSLLAADTAFAVTILSGTYYNGSWLEAGWLLAYVFLGAAALHPSASELTFRRQDSSEGLSPSRAAVLAAASLMAPAALAIQTLRGKNVDVWLVAPASAVLFLLVVARMSGLVREVAVQREELIQTLAQLEQSQADRRRLLDSTVGATEEERKRIAAELHDGPIQGLTRLGLLLARATLKLDRKDVTGTGALLNQVKEELSGDIQELRRTMASLRPPVLDERGLDAALRDYADSLFRETGLRCTVRSTLDVRLPPAVETVLYRVGQEALFNIVKHAHATEACASLEATNGSVVLEVRDDGRGFDPERVVAGDEGDRFGLLAMRERVEMAGGSWELASGPGQGVVIRARLPVRPAALAVAGAP